MPTRRSLGRILGTLLLTATAYAAAPLVPRKAPEFVSFTMGAQQELFSQYRNQPTILIFILTYCGHCQTTIQMLTKLYPEYATRGLKIHAVAIEDNARYALPRFMAQFRPPFPVNYAERVPVQTFLQLAADDKMMMPQVVFVDRQNMIRFQAPGDDEFFNVANMEKNLRAKIELILGGPAHAKK